MTIALDHRKKLRAMFRWILLVMVLIALAGIVFIGEIIAEQKIAALPDYAPARRLMAGESEGLSLVPNQHVVGQPYLLYIPAPNLESMGHNAHGYRGAIVPVERTPGIVRILFLGGSTTYGTGVSNPLNAWPEVAASFARKSLPPGITGIEVINAAAPWATSAEWVTHYLFKFHYYKPDIVVVNDSGNDAGMLERSHYHPDYSNCRQSLTNIKPLPPRYRWMMRSSILSLFLLDCFQVESITQQTFVPTEWQTKPLAPWFEAQSERIMDQQDYLPKGDELSYDHNLEVLIRAAKEMDGCRMLFVPFRARPNSVYNDLHLRLAAAMESVLLAKARNHQIPVAPFPAAELIPTSGWSDEYCHLNAEGERIKGEYMGMFLSRLVYEVAENRESSASFSSSSPDSSLKHTAPAHAPSNEAAPPHTLGFKLFLQSGERIVRPSFADLSFPTNIARPEPSSSHEVVWQSEWRASRGGEWFVFAASHKGEPQIELSANKELLGVFTLNGEGMRKDSGEGNVVYVPVRTNDAHHGLVFVRLDAGIAAHGLAVEFSLRCTDKSLPDSWAGIVETHSPLAFRPKGIALPGE